MPYTPIATYTRRQLHTALTFGFTLLAAGCAVAAAFMHEGQLLSFALPIGLLMFGMVIIVPLCFGILCGAIGVAESRMIMIRQDDTEGSVCESTYHDMTDAEAIEDFVTEDLSDDFDAPTLQAFRLVITELAATVGPGETKVADDPSGQGVVTFSRLA